jgi:hypothetical protein
MDGFVSELAQHMTSVAAAPGDLVVKEGEVGEALFILLTGPRCRRPYTPIHPPPHTIMDRSLA